MKPEDYLEDLSGEPDSNWKPETKPPLGKLVRRDPLLRLDWRGLHFPRCPRFDEWSDAHPWKCAAVLAGVAIIVELAVCAVVLFVKLL